MSNMQTVKESILAQERRRNMINKANSKGVMCKGSGKCKTLFGSNKTGLYFH